jgi:hypothetical protein
MRMGSSGSQSRFPEIQVTDVFLAGVGVRNVVSKSFATSQGTPIFGVSGLFKPSRGSRRADSNRLPLLQLRVITQALQGCAGSCRTRISKRVSVLWFAAYCIVVRFRWYQSGIRSACSPGFADSEREIRCLTLPPPPERRRRPHLASSPGPFATPAPMLPLPCPSAQRKCERQPRRGSRCLLECPLFRVRPAPHSTAAPPAPFLLLLQPGRQIPPRSSGLPDSLQSPMRGRGFLCRDQQLSRNRPGAGLSIPGCKDQ